MPVDGTQAPCGIENHEPLEAARLNLEMMKHQEHEHELTLKLTSFGLMLSEVTTPRHLVSTCTKVA